MTEELTLKLTDLEKKAITFCREKDVPFPITNYLVEFAEEVTKELQYEARDNESEAREVNMRMHELITETVPQLAEAKEIIRLYYSYNPSSEYSYEEIERKAEEFLKE